MRKIGFKDKNGIDIKEGDWAITYDRTGKKWIGQIVRVDPDKIIGSRIIDNGGIQYAFKSNYETWINNQEFASELEVLSKNLGPFDLFIGEYKSRYSRSGRQGDFYIYTNHDKSRYLHKDGTIHNICGVGNFWSTIEEAQNAIDDYYQINQRVKNFEISLEEMMI